MGAGIVFIAIEHNTACSEDINLISIPYMALVIVTVLAKTIKKLLRIFKDVSTFMVLVSLLV